MARTIPYIFCRYEMTVDDERLGTAGQIAFFSEGQGQPRPYIKRGASAPEGSITFAEVSSFQHEGIDCLSLLVGMQAGVRTIVEVHGTQRTRRPEIDTHTKFAHVVMIPSVNLMAIQDRANDECIPAKMAITILRSILRGEDGDFSVIHLNDQEVRHAVQTWELIDYRYTVRPLNPISLSDLANERSDRMKAENVGKEVGSLTAREGERMHPAGGTISQTQEMVDVGYGQNGFKGYTPDGHLGHVPKPPFHWDKAKNFAERDKSRFLRIMFDATIEGEATLSPIIATALMRFYAPNEQETELS